MGIFGRRVKAIPESLIRIRDFQVREVFPDAGISAGTYRGGSTWWNLDSRLQKETSRCSATALWKQSSRWTQEAIRLRSKLSLLQTAQSWLARSTGWWDGARVKCSG